MSASVRVDASVIICAYTEARWDDLRAAVFSVQRQSVAPLEIVIVIDHNDRLLERARAEFIGVVVARNEETRGLSGARNTGIRTASGSLLAFLDDDAVAATDWLEVLVSACDDPTVLGCGGFIEPAWQSDKPLWFPEEFNWVVGCSYLGLPAERSIVRNLIGSSMCIRREVFEAVGFFRGEVGRVGSRPVGCEETELCIRARQHWPKREFLYEPMSHIHHVVPASRARWGYFSSRCFFEGRSKAQVARLAGANDGLSSERAYTRSVLPHGVVRNLAEVVKQRNPHGFARAAAIVAGLAITTTGYGTGAMTHAVRDSKTHIRRYLREALGPARRNLFPAAKFQQEDGD